MRSNVPCRIKRQTESSIKGMAGRSQHTASEGWSSVKCGL